MMRYLRHFRGSRPTLVFLAVVLAFLGVLPAAGVWLLGHALDALLAGRTVGHLALGLVGLATLQALGSVGRARVSRELSWNLVHRLRSRVHEQLSRIEPIQPVGERLAALTHEIDELQYGVSALVTAIRAPVAAVALGLSAVALAPWLAVRFLVVLPAFGGVAWGVGRVVRQATSTWQRERAALLRELADQHGGLRTTRDLRAQELQQSRMVERSAREAAARAWLDWAKGWPSAVGEWMLVCAIALLLWFGQRDVASGVTSPGALVAFVVAIGLLRKPLVQLSEVWVLLQRSMAALERVETVLETPSVRDNAGADGAFRFEGAVPGRVQGCVTVAPGQKVAIVGSSGAGKSSLLAALAGQLEVDGVLERSRAMFLRQDPWVFDRSVGDNLRLGAPAAEDAALQQSLAGVGLDLDLEAPAGEHGGRLSGGERQRLCLARALLGSPIALLLDECTSELDPPRSEQIARLLGDLDATVLFASHDDSFLALADRVLWIENGAIVACDTHQRLMAAHPDYRRFWSGAA